jgi:hypothetical protein
MAEEWRVEHQKAGGGAGDAVTASGGEVGRRWATWRGQRVASARAGSGGAEAGVARGEVQSSAETAGAAHMAGTAAARGREEHVTVRVLAILEIYFVSVKYVFVCIKLMCVYVKFLKI